MKISKNTRPYRAGLQMGKALIETVHILYLNDNCLEYLYGLRRIINREINRRKFNGGKHTK